MPLFRKDEPWLDEHGYPKCLYHHKHAPRGKEFYSPDETVGLKRRGWVDTPAKFPPPSKVVLKLRALKPWWTEWEWLLKPLGKVLGFLITIAVAYFFGRASK